VQAEAQTPDTQKGSDEVQSRLDLHWTPAFGWQAPLVHVNPLPQEEPLQPARH
jgi:hypothetical protein